MDLPHLEALKLRSEYIVFETEQSNYGMVDSCWLKMKGLQTQETME